MQTKERFPKKNIKMSDIVQKGGRCQKKIKF